MVHLEVCQAQVFLELLIFKVQQVTPGYAICFKGAPVPDAYLRQQLHCLCYRVSAHVHHQAIRPASWSKPGLYDSQTLGQQAPVRNPLLNSLLQFY